MPVSSMSDKDKNQVHALREHYDERIKAYSDAQVIHVWSVFSNGKFMGSYMSIIQAQEIFPRTSVEDNIIYNLRGELKEKVKHVSDRALLEGYNLFCISEDYPDMNKFVEFYLS